jgi:hypothetical protein
MDENPQHGEPGHVQPDAPDGVDVVRWSQSKTFSPDDARRLAEHLITAYGNSSVPILLHVGMTRPDGTTHLHID